MGSKLFRSREDNVIGGVCGGLGKYFDINPIIFRFAFVALMLAGGSSVIIYVLLLIIIPKEPLQVYNDTNVNNSFDEFQQKDLLANETDNGTKTIFGLILISSGALLLLNNIIPMINLKKIWPAILIIIGMGLLFQKNKKED